jgi:hypothetical protein
MNTITNHFENKNAGCDAGEVKVKVVLQLQHASCNVTTFYLCSKCKLTRVYVRFPSFLSQSMSRWVTMIQPPALKEKIFQWTPYFSSKVCFLWITPCDVMVMV